MQFNTIGNRSNTLSKSLSSNRTNTLGRQHKENLFETFSRRKKLNKKEVENLTLEGKNAIESPFKRVLSEVEDYDIKDKTVIVDKNELNREEVKILVDILMNWMNKILEPKRIIVKNITEDLRDGQILHELAQYVCGTKIEFPEVTISEVAQKQKIKLVLDTLHNKMDIKEGDLDMLKWNVNDINDGNAVAILCLLVRIVQFFDKEVRLPLNVSINITKVVRNNDTLAHKRECHEITGMFDGDSLAKIGKDSFDTLFASAPDKIDDVKSSLLNFVNGHFHKLNVEVQDIETEFRDGVYLIYLMGLLENYYVPTYAFHLPACDFNVRLENVNFVYELMEDAGIPRSTSVPEDIVLGDLKATMRVLYAMFSHFKDF